jgi:hypothetical protein
VAIADAADGRLNPGLGEALGVLDRTGCRGRCGVSGRHNGSAGADNKACSRASRTNLL